MPETHDATHWKERYELERERLVKLYVAYKTLEEELDDLRASKPEPLT